MVQHVCEQSHEHIGTGQAAHVLDELAHQHRHHAVREHPADGAAEGIQDKARQSHVPLAEFFGQRPHGKNADAHGDAADGGYHRLGDAVVVSTQHVVAEIRQADVFDAAAGGVDEEVGIDQEHVFVCEDRLELRCKGNDPAAVGLRFLRDPLFGEVVFQQRQRQSQDGQHAHEKNPLALVHAEHGHDDHGEHQCYQNAAHHDGGDLIEHRETAPLSGIPNGQRHHQVVAHVENGVGKGIEQIVGDHDPDDLHGLGRTGHRKEQDAGDCQQRRTQQQPGSRFALRGAGAVNDIPHDDVGDGIDDFGDDGKDDQERPAPDRGQLEHICVVHVQISRQHCVQQQRTGRTEEIPQPLFRRRHIR